MRRNQKQGRLKTPCFFQELPPDVRQLVWEETRFNMGIVDSQGKISSEHIDDVLRFGLDRLLDETTDDFINRCNQRRTIQEWLRFAQKGGL